MQAAIGGITGAAASLAGDYLQNESHKIDYRKAAISGVVGVIGGIIGGSGIRH